MKREFDAIIIGSGFGGVTCAAVLAQNGLSVLVLDKNRRPGGKAMRVQRDGVVHDLWPISGGPAKASRFHDLIRVIGGDPATLLTPEVGAEFIYLLPGGERRRMTVPARPVRNPLHTLQLLRKLGVRTAEFPAVLAFTALTSVLPDGVIARMDGIPMHRWIEAFRLPRPFADLLLNLQNIFYVTAADRVPVSEGLRSFREIAAGGAGRYHRGGYGSVAEAAIGFVQRKSGSWLPGTRVHKINTTSTGVVGVLTDRGDFQAPVVVSNAGIQPTVLKLAADAHFPPEYVRHIRALEPSWAFVGVRYELRANVVTVPMTIAYSPDSAFDSIRFAAAERGNWPHNSLLLVTVPSLYDPALGSPEIPQVVLAGVLGSPDPMSAMNRRAIQKVDEMLDRLWPEMKKQIVRRQTFGAGQVSKATRDAVVPGQGGECIGLAQVIGQCGRSKPSPRSPLRGLYFTGCDAGGHGIGTTQAVDSGFAVADMVMADLGRRSGWSRSLRKRVRP